MTERPLVSIEFTDGDCVEALVLHVDRTDHQDVTFDVIRIIRGDPNRYAKLAAYIAPLADIVRMEPVE